MIVYRIAKKKSRSEDLSGQGAANAGGRWNSQGVHATYTSESRSLALLEILVHVDIEDLPDNLFVMVIEIAPEAQLLEISDSVLPINWREPDNLALKSLGDSILSKNQHIGFKVRSAVLPAEFNVILNPKHPDFNILVKVVKSEEFEPDKRL